MEVGFEMALEQKQTLSQTQIQSLEILAMDSIELNRFLHDEYLENPILDYSGGGSGPVKTQELNTEYINVPFYKHGEDISEEREKNDGIIPAEEKDTVKQYLMWQLDRGQYMDEQWTVIEYLIDCLEDNGFFTVPIEEVARKCMVSVHIAEKCLEDLQQLEPYGIFALDLKHCLLKQLQVMGMEDSDEWKIVDGYLEEVAEGKISVIYRELKLPTAKVRRCIENIGGLNPRPLTGFNTEKTSYVVPDIILKKEGGVWSGDLNDSWVQDYRINDYYLQMMKESKEEELVNYFRTRLERVRFIMNSIEQRRQTMMGIVNLIIEKQADFLDGKGPLKPMTMSDAAKELGVHPSTVSRAIRGKYVQYPSGSIFMKSLFTASASRESNGEDGITTMGIKQCIKELIEGENKKKPYSDQELAKKLEERDIHISRRAVAKYREEMQIRGSFERKSFA